MASSFAVGLVSALPAALLVILKKPSWAVLISVLIACIAVGLAAYSLQLTRKRDRSSSPPPSQSLSSADLLAHPISIQTVRDQYERWQDDLSDKVFDVLWNRPQPSQPVAPDRLVEMLANRFPHLVHEHASGEMVRAIEEIRVLQRLPMLAYSPEGYFLVGDDFRLNKSIDRESKLQIARVAASYVTSGMSIALDGGTTTLEVANVLLTRIMAKTLDRIRLTSASIQICSGFLEMHESREAIRTGSLEVWSMAGPLHASCWTVDPPPSALLPWALDLAIIGANGITQDGFFLPTTRGLEVKKTFITHSPLTLIVADANKVGRTLHEQFATWNDPVKLITNRPTQKAKRQILASFPRGSVIYSPARVKQQ